MAYLFALTVAWGAFAALYHWLLAKETFFSANRWYLLSALVGGLVLPFLAQWFVAPTVSQFAPALEAFLPAITVGIAQAEPDWAAHVGWVQFVVFVWAAGSIFGLGRCIYGLSAIDTLARKARQERDNLLFSDAIDMPFSFFGKIFVPAAYAGDAAQLETIILHENAHATGWHSLDVLFGELVCIVLWWHPLAHWYRRQLRLVHEYIADEAAVRHSPSRKQYGLLLIQQAQSGPVLAYANHFLQSPLKQRLIMLSKQHSAPVRSLRYALVLPLLACLLALFGPNTASAQVRKDKDVVEIGEVDVLPAFAQGAEAGLMKYLADNIAYPAEAKAAKVQGMVALSFVINTVGAVEDIKVLKAPHQTLGEEAVRVVKTTRWTVGQKDGKSVKVRYTLPIKFKLD
jgi:TonB family protein